MDLLSSPQKPFGGVTLNGLNELSQPPPADSSIDTQSQDLWSSILDSVKSSKAVAAKNIIVLGEPRSGKSTLISALASSSPSGFISSSVTNKSSSSPLLGSNETEESNQPPVIKENGKAAKDDLGLGYGYFHVGDEKDKDEIVARVGVYTIHSSDTSYTSLLPFAFPTPVGTVTAEHASAAMSFLAATSGSSSLSVKLADRFIPKASIESLQDSLILILLDWEQPWTFLEQLRNWLGIIQDTIDRSTDGALTNTNNSQQKWSKTKVILDEMRERLEIYIRSYVEPLPPTASATSATSLLAAAAGATASAAAVNTLSVALEGQEQPPLTEGMLSENWGIPIVVACTKADLISKLERDKDFKEEQFDYIQQVLRTVCMKYGAGLFFTSHTRAQSFDVLRSYVLHRLYTPALSASLAVNGNPGHQINGVGAAATGSTAFPFPYRALTTDRDILLVPSGWDSWGKIKALRDGFDCDSMGRGWEYDCEIDRLRRQRNLPKGDKQVEDQLEQEIQRDLTDKVRSAVKLYEDIVADWQAGPTSHANHNRVKMPNEQSFLGQHYSTLQKDPDPRSKFGRQTSVAGTPAASASLETTTTTNTRGVVGPMGGLSRGLPNIEKLVSEREPSLDDDPTATASSSSSSARTAKSGPTTRRDNTRDGLTLSSSGVVASPSGAGNASSSSRSKDATNPLAIPLASSTATRSDRDRGSVSPRPTSPSLASSSTSNSPAIPAPKQSEVLHSFFQSLLKEKSTSSSSSSSSKLGGGNGTRSSRNSHQHHHSHPRESLSSPSTNVTSTSGGSLTPTSSTAPGEKS